MKRFTWRMRLGLFLSCLAVTSIGCGGGGVSEGPIQADPDAQEDFVDPSGPDPSEGEGEP
jgi:hypothetical protein